MNVSVSKFFSSIPLLSGLKQYLWDMWNLLDLTIIFTYLAGLVVRLENLDALQNKVDTKVIHTFVCMMLWIRLMRYYAVNNTLGTFFLQWVSKFVYKLKSVVLIRWAFSFFYAAFSCF